MSKEIPQPEGVLQNIITYFCFKANPLSTTKLVKLVYLADVYHTEMFGSRLTDVPFKHYNYGPWAPQIDEAFENLCNKGVLGEETVQTREGHLASVPRPKIPEVEVRLPESALKALDAVVEDWGGASTREIVGFAKNTLPFVGTPFDQEIDFSRTDPVVAYAREKGLPLKEAATALVEGDRDLMDSLARAKGTG